MHAQIYYFSATGNSLHVARTIAGTLGNCSLTSMTALRDDENITAAGDLIGLVFPMHYFGLPPIVSRFVGNINLQPESYVFAVVTCGFSYISGSLHQLGNLLAKKGGRLDAGFHMNMISSYIPLSCVPEPDKQSKILAKAEEKTVRLAKRILARERMIEPEYLWPVCRIINRYWQCKLLPGTDRKFSNSGACIACGLCEKVCPVNNIEMVDGKPSWKHQCQECLACMHFCPVRSIDFGTRTCGRERYHHPKVGVQDIIQPKIRPQ